MQAHLALCCKALLPILGMGHVRVNLNTPKTGRALLNATHCLTKQPGSVLHLEVCSWNPNRVYNRPGTRNLIDLRCACAHVVALVRAWCGPSLAMPVQHMGWLWCQRCLVPTLLCASAAC